MNAIRTFYKENIPSLCVLLCAAIFCTFLLGGYAAALVPLSENRIVSADSATPLAAPAAVISAVGEDTLILSDAAREKLNALGQAVYVFSGMSPAVSETSPAVSEKNDFLSLSLFAAPQTYLADAVTLISGRLPQNGTECVILSADILSALDTAADDLIGTVLPVSGTVTSLTGEASPAVSLLTVVGVGTNSRMTLYANTEAGIPTAVLTTDSAAWTSWDGARGTVYLVSENAGETLSDDIRAIYEETYSAQLDALIAHNGAVLSEAQSACEEAVAALSAQEIAVLEAENRYDTACLRVTEAEDALLAASDALEAERQQFYSDMETYEYYSSNQVALISRRDLAEESFAKQEAVIALLQTALDEAYDARNAAEDALDGAKAEYTALEETRITAEKALDRASVQNYTDITAPAWDVTLRREQSDYTAALDAARSERNRVLLPAAVCAALSVLLVFTVFGKHGLDREFFGRMILCAVIAAAAGVLIGVGILAGMRVEGIVGV